MRLRFTYHDGKRSMKVDIAGFEAGEIASRIHDIARLRTHQFLTGREALESLTQRFNPEYGLGAALAQMHTWAEERPDDVWFMIWRIGWFGLKLPWLGYKRPLQANT